MTTETLTPMAELSRRWGVTANTVSRRLAFLGIKPIRQGNLRFITAEQLNLANELNAHMLGNNPQESFPRPDQPEGGLVARRAPQVAQVTGLVRLAHSSPASAVGRGRTALVFLARGGTFRPTQ